MTEQSLILVTGATGNVGGQVVSQLLRTGSGVRALTRDPGGAALPGGIEVVRGDLSMPSALDACLHGVDAVFLVWPFPFLAAEAAAPGIEAVAKHARRIVYLSSSGCPMTSKRPTCSCRSPTSSA